MYEQELKFAPGGKPRHPAVIGVLRFFDTRHLPPATLISSEAQRFADIAIITADRYADLDDPELTWALRALLEAKDAAVRCAVLAEKAARGSDAPIVNPSEFGDARPS